jgi:putative endonuclease
MTFFTYVLYSEKYNKIYIGYSSDLDLRLSFHNDPENKGWTKKYQPWIVYYFEEFRTKPEAMNREKQLKSAQGRKFVHNMIQQKQLNFTR